MKKALIFISILLVLVFGLLFWWINESQAPNKDDKSQKIFVIEKGEGIREIGSSLKKEGFIKDPVAFFLYVKKESKDKNIQAGDYRLSPSMDLKNVVENLSHGTLDIWITFPEGLRAEEYAQILKDDFKNYKREWIDVLVQNEGYLFPDTYLFPKDVEIAQVVSIMRNNFNSKAQDLVVDKNKLDKTVVIASIIEREAKYPEDKSLVSSVLYNRLNIGMALQVDASVQYALSYNDKNKTWWKKVSPSDLTINSPYNTYTNIGLPPGPICNPGIVSLKAAANPPDTNYIYYVSDKSGHLHFAKNLTEHNQNIKKYLNN